MPSVNLVAEYSTRWSSSRDPSVNTKVLGLLCSRRRREGTRKSYTARTMACISASRQSHQTYYLWQLNRHLPPDRGHAMQWFHLTYCGTICMPFTGARSNPFVAVLGIAESWNPVTFGIVNTI